MPRTARIKSVSGIYHVMLRGADRRIIFGDDEDCQTFLDILYHIRKKHKFSLYALCLMGNHVHLLIREEAEPLQTIMKRLGVTYVSYYNLKYDLLGHLFQDRFRSEPVETTAYFMDVLRYICQNPVKAGLSKSPKQYKWLRCSGMHKDELLDPLEGYSSLKGQALLEFLEGPCSEEHLDDPVYKRMTDKKAIEIICRMSGCSYVQEISGLPEQQQEKLIREARKAAVSIRQLSRLTGISKTKIERIAKEKKRTENK